MGLFHWLLERAGYYLLEFDWFFWALGLILVSCLHLTHWVSYYLYLSRNRFSNNTINFFTFRISFSRQGCIRFSARISHFLGRILILLLISFINLGSTTTLKRIHMRFIPSNNLSGRRARQDITFLLAGLQTRNFLGFIVLKLWIKFLPRQT